MCKKNPDINQNKINPSNKQKKAIPKGSPGHGQRRAKTVKAVPRPEITPGSTIGKRVLLIGANTHAGEEGVITGWETMAKPPYKLCPRVKLELCPQRIDSVLVYNYNAQLYFLDGFRETDIEEQRALIKEKVSVYDQYEYHKIRDCVLVETFYKAGAVKKVICELLGVSRAWLNNRISSSDYLKSAYVDAQESMGDMMESTLIMRAKGYDHEEEKIFQYQGNIVTHTTNKHYPPDPASAIGYLEARHKDRGYGKQKEVREEVKGFEDIVNESWEKNGKVPELAESETEIESEEQEEEDIDDSEPDEIIENTEDS